MQEVQGWSMFLRLRKLKQWIDSRKHWMQDKEQVGMVGHKSGCCNKEKDSARRKIEMVHSWQVKLSTKIMPHSSFLTDG
jgi:hypothetical protein